MTKVVFFDLDDTLYDHTGTVDATLHQLKERLPAIADFSDDELRKQYSDFLEKYHRYFIDGVFTFEETHRNRWQAMLEHWQIRDVEAEEMWLFWRKHYLANRRLVSGAKELLESLRQAGITTGIVTNNSVSEQVGKLRTLAIEHLIDHLVISEEAGFAKPDERIYSLALQRANIDASEAVMVGDHWENDILPPLRLGMGSVWFNRKRAAPLNPAMIKEIYSLEPADETIVSILNE